MQETEKLLSRFGWQVECYSPFEIRHEDGSFATLNAAWMIVDSLRKEESDILADVAYQQVVVVPSIHIKI